jgi:hypothetical protein
MGIRELQGEKLNDISHCFIIIGDSNVIIKKYSTLVRQL